MFSVRYRLAYQSTVPKIPTWIWLLAEVDVPASQVYPGPTAPLRSSLYPGRMDVSWSPPLHVTQSLASHVDCAPTTETKVRKVFRVFYILLRNHLNEVFFVCFFSVRLLSVLRGHSVFHPRHNGQWPPTLKDFLSQILSITFIFLS